MPKFATDKTKAAAYITKRRVATEAERAAQAEKARRTEAALEELRQAVARQLGIDPAGVMMFICKR